MTINPRMLILAREARGLSQAELTKTLITISQATYSRIEKGIVEIQENQLNELSKHLDFPVSFFNREGKIPGSYQEYFYRKRQTLPKKQQIKLEATFDLIRMFCEDLLESVDIPDFSLPEIEIEHTNTAEVIANKVRRYLGIERGPIANLIELLERNGVMIFLLQNAPDKFDGTTVITKSGTRVIVLNENMPNYRKRFTISHELCHILCHIPFTSENPFKTDADIEKEADTFASEFLMPSDQIRNELYRLTYAKLTDIKGYWKVSKSSIIYRAHKLGCIDMNRFIYLMTELSRYNERKVEKNDVPMEDPQLLRLITDTFHKSLGFTDEEFMSALTINKDDFDFFILNKKRSTKMRIAV
ncbi:helix-turn-helix domain-containing protein [Mucilaginibacter ginkgonis]|uniref:ImmA/IrrE family metallo-endopeptidase n=1 Tax=Mucilaginibacter ginkgonis TaxID=2682091 RepID=A0A6I4IMX3_9SPHI|nr:XRE family transcriptional regulator [Mucilaginibacter ginkgonis]QQL51199.1 ImmA/IrrE family metallo-endopeptidase [Mucilaginibacter ginkgonis]